MLSNLLQRGFQHGANPAAPNPFDNPAFVVVGVLGGCLWVAYVAAALGVFILVLVRAMQALTEVRKRNRTMEPGMVWLSFIPLFGVVWLFLVVTKTADAVANECDDRRLRGKEDGGKSMGLTYAILTAVNYVGGVLTVCFAPFACVVLVAGVVQFIFGFLYASNLKAVTQRLRDDEAGDDPDDEPRRKPRKPAADDFEEFDGTGDDRR